MEKAAGDIAPAALKTIDDDPELDDLLNSALEDFGKPPPTECNVKGQQTSSQSAGSKQDKVKTTVGDAISGSQEALFNDVFTSGLASHVDSQDMESMMRSMMSSDPQLLTQFDQLHSVAHSQDTGTDETDGKKQFADALQQTLGSLAQNVDNIQTEGEDPFSDDELMKLVSGLNFEDGDESNSGFVPLMQGMMKSILSKDILYPSLKDIVSKYPAWLSSNKDRLDSVEFTKYSRQFELMQRICEQFEKETTMDTEDKKTKHFDVIMDLMQKMQDLGQPPKEILGDGPGLPFGSNAEQCTVM